MGVSSIFLSLRRLMPVIVSASLLAAGAAARANDRITIQRNATVGEVWTFDRTTDMQLSQKISSNGQVDSRDSKMHQRRVGKYEVLTAQNGLPTSVKVTFGNDCENSMEVTGQPPMKPTFPLTGQTLTVSRQADGSVTSDFRGQLDPGSQNELQQLLEPETSIYPAKPVAVGEEWPGDPQAVAKQFQLNGPNDRAGMTMKLLSIKQINGRPVAEVKVSAAAVQESQGVSNKTVLQGVALIDLGTGSPIKFDLNGTLTEDGGGSGPGPNGQMQTFKMDGNGPIAISQMCNLTAGGATAAAPAPAPGPGNAGGNPPVMDTGNPLAQGGGADFSGKYSDGKLTLGLTEAIPNNYTGTIMLGQQSYNAAASVKNGSLEGTFDTGQKRFAFTATMVGDTMTFKTGTTTYTLKKQFANPLDQ